MCCVYVGCIANIGIDDSGYSHAEDDGMCSFDANMCNVRERVRARTANEVKRGRL